MKIMKISLRKVSIDNWYQCTQLSVTEEQKKLFPAPIVYWIAESKYIEEYELLAIYCNEDIVGFIVYCSSPDKDGNYWIPALMVDAKFQGRGYAKEAMVQLIQLMKVKHKYNKIMIGHRQENRIAGRLYESLGFARISDKLIDGEVIRLLS
jgi:diamine N-acetyltransferase